MVTQPTLTPTSPSLIPPGTWRIDPARSDIAFRVRSFGVLPVRGRFGRIAGTISSSTPLMAEGEIAVESVDTGNARRDRHLASPDFLDAERHPEIRFAVPATGAGADAGPLLVALTVRGVTRTVELAARAVSAGPGDDDAFAVAASGRLDRREFGVEPGGPTALVVGRTVEVSLLVVAVRAA